MKPTLQTDPRVPGAAGEVEPAAGSGVRQDVESMLATLRATGMEYPAAIAELTRQGVDGFALLPVVWKGSLPLDTRLGLVYEIFVQDECFDFLQSEDDEDLTLDCSVLDEHADRFQRLGAWLREHGVHPLSLAFLGDCHPVVHGVGKALGVEEDLLKCLRDRIHLDLVGSRLTELPEGLIIPGYLDAVGSKLERLPASLSVKKGAFLSNSQQLQAIPDGVSIQEVLIAEHCPLLERLPEGLQLNRLSVALCPNLKELPKSLSVKNELNVSKSGIKVLSHAKGLQIGDPEWMPADCQVRAVGCAELTEIDLPGLQVKGLKASHCDNLERVTGPLVVKDELDLSMCPKLRSLPRDLKAEGWIKLTGCPDWDGKLPEGVDARATVWSNATNRERPDGIKADAYRKLQERVEGHA